jgi:hypothetical protein
MSKSATLFLIFGKLILGQSYLSNAPGSVARPIAEKLADTLSVRDFGARGDGIADDTAALQAAVRAAQAAARPLFIPAGTYRHLGLTIAGGIDLHGEGAPLYTVLKYEGTGTALQLRNAGGRLRNFAVMSTGSAATAIDVFNGSELYFDHVQVGGSPASRFATGVRLSQSAAVTFEHLVSSWNDVGVLLDAGDWANAHVVIHDGNLFEHAVAPIQIRQGTGVYIERNWIEGFQSGILLDTAAGFTTANSVVVRNNSMISVHPGALALRINGAAAHHPLYVYNFLFEGNKVSTAPGKYNVDLSYVGSARGSIGDFCFRNNLFSGAQVAAVHGDSPIIQFYSDGDRIDPFGPAYPVLSSELASSATAREELCGEQTAGKVLYTPGGPGRKDTLRVCLKNATDDFAWVAVH